LSQKNTPQNKTTPQISPQLTPTNKNELRTKATLMARLNTLQLIHSKESDFAKLIKDIENDPIFKKLISPKNNEYRAIRYQPHPRTSKKSYFLELKESITPSGASNSIDVEEFLKNNKEIIPLIHKIGQEKFERYFLYCTESCNLDEIAEICSLDEPETDKIRQFLLDFSIKTSFFQNSQLSQAAGIRYYIMAKVCFDSDGNFFFEFKSPHLTRGRYKIDYAKMENFKKQKIFSKSELVHIKSLFHKMELINWRQDTVFRLLELIIMHQQEYLRDKNIEKIYPLPQKKLADELNLSPSTINRALTGRSVIAPWNEELPLSSLCFSRRKVITQKISIILAKLKNSKLTDEAIRELLKKDYGINVARRTVNLYRNDLETPS